MPTSRLASWRRAALWSLPRSRELVVVGAGAGEAVSAAEGLAAEGVEEPVVVDVAGQHELLLAGLRG